MTALLATMPACKVDDGGVATTTTKASTAGGVGNAGEVSKLFDAIAKPEADNRLYRGLQLANGMKVRLFVAIELELV